MSKFLEDCAEFLKTQPFNVFRISEIFENGEPETIELLPTNPCQNGYSVAKAFTMTAIGLLYDRGMVSLDEKICDIFADELPEGMDERWRKSTVEMALKHRLGLPGGFLDIDCNPISDFGEDFLSYMLTYPLIYDPDTDSKYSDGAYYLLARIVEKKTGMGVDNFLWKEMLHGLGFQELAWSHCPYGHVIGATGIYAHSSDIVKLGAVYLNGGTYKGKRYLSEEWTRLAVEREFAFDWDIEHKVFFKGGMCGQRLVIDPRVNRIFYVQSFGADTHVITEWLKNYN